jgi:hypothetical protein
LVLIGFHSKLGTNATGPAQTTVYTKLVNIPENMVPSECVWSPGVYATAVATTTSDGEIVPFPLGPLGKGIDEKDGTPAGDDACGVGRGKRSGGGGYHHPVP